MTETTVAIPGLSGGVELPRDASMAFTVRGASGGVRQTDLIDRVYLRQRREGRAKTHLPQHGCFVVVSPDSVYHAVLLEEMKQGHPWPEADAAAYQAALEVVQQMPTAGKLVGEAQQAIMALNFEREQNMNKYQGAVSGFGGGQQAPTAGAQRFTGPGGVVISNGLSGPPAGGFRAPMVRPAAPAGVPVPMTAASNQTAPVEGSFYTYASVTGEEYTWPRETYNPRTGALEPVPGLYATAALLASIEQAAGGNPLTVYAALGLTLRDVTGKIVFDAVAYREALEAEIAASQTTEEQAPGVALAVR